MAGVMKWRRSSASAKYQCGEMAVVAINNGALSENNETIAANRGGVAKIINGGNGSKMAIK
jgi:hypothetical protein